MVDLVNGDNVNTDMTLSLGENFVSFSDTLVHLVVTRAGKKEHVINVETRISSARRTSYSLMNTGLHGANELSPEVQNLRYSRLLYGLVIIPLKPQLYKINIYHIMTLRNIQSLPQWTATSAVNLLLGRLPLEADLHKILLSLLYNVIKSENNYRRDLVERQLACIRRFFSMWSIKPYLSLYELQVQV